MMDVSYVVENLYHQDLQGELMDISTCKGFDIKDVHNVFQASLRDYEVVKGCNKLSIDFDRLEQLNYGFDEAIRFMSD